ncbi:MAG: hypothetical protein JSW50_13175 [Candidatus Latescibacterota bacterium]|nr:MAG: hypothetical protein JSW50_13175 [Candidatus Latescibacterota bacterium]
MKARVMIVCLAAVVFAAFFFACMGDPTTQDVSTTAPQLAKGVKNDGGGAQVKAKMDMAAHFAMEATTGGCYNSPGPYITLEGEIALGGLNGVLIFRNNRQGTHEHEEDVVVSIVIVPEGETIRFAKQPPLGGAGGNPWISFQLLDGRYRPLSDEILLGRCVQGLMMTEFDFSMASTATAGFTSGDCDNSGGPQITINGELSLGGLNGKLIFKNNAKGTHRRDEITEVSIVIVPEGETIEFPKQPPLGGAGGNPHIFFAFTDGDGNPMSGEFYLGRCVQLGK